MAERKTSSRPRLRRDWKALLDECRDMVAEQLVGAFPGMMDKVDDALFDRLDQSENAGEHKVYFDAMRDMRLRRTEIETTFKQRFEELVREVLRRVADSKPAATGAGTPELKLGLVDESELEESLAVANMASKIRNTCHEELFALEQRMAHLLARKDLGNEGNPLGPEPICCAFKDACAVVETSLEVRLLILKFFDRFVASEVGEIYHRINGHLIGKGILPQIRPVVVKQRSVGNRASNANPAPAPCNASSVQHQDGNSSAGDPGAAELLNALQQMMSGNPGVGAPALAGRASPRQAEVLNNLTLLQQGNGLGGAGNDTPIDPRLLVSGDTNVLRDLKTTQVTAGMDQVDIIMFDVVAMMFDFILDDRNVPDPMKALIGRLQIPMLKVSLVDKTFFSRKNHPARKLLNTFAEAAIGWDRNHDEGGAYYAKIESLVHRIIEEFEDSIDVFSDVLEELEAFLSDREHVANEQTLSSTKAIEDRSRLNQARERAQEVIAGSCHGKPVPAWLQKFFYNRWKELLVFHYFDGGEDSEGWRSAIKTMQELIWSLTPISSPKDRKKLVALLPSLLGRVKAGMEQMSLPRKERKKLLAMLANHHLTAMRAGDGGAAPSSPAPDDVEATGRVESLLKQAIERANAAIHMAAKRKPECAGMGTTLVAARFHDNKVAVAHVGDSRLYRLKNGSLEQLTLDHSLMQDLISKGTYTPEEAKQKVKSNIITRAVGVDESVDADVQEIDAAPGDLFLLCSDGLTDMVDDNGILARLQKEATDLGAASESLVTLANEKGGRDNISVVLARVLEPFAGELGGRIEIAGKTHVGRRRSHNEDGIAIDPDAGFALVADGMGGSNAGEVASAIALEVIVKFLREEIVAASSGDRDDLGWMTTIDESSLQEHIPEEETQTIEQRHLDFVESLPMGAWVEFKSPSGSRTRARLAWVSHEADRYLFTDLEGSKVTDATAHALALELQRGNITLIEDEPLVDRVMSNVTARLKSGEVNGTVH